MMQNALLPPPNLYLTKPLADRCCRLVYQFLSALWRVDIVKRCIIDPAVSAQILAVLRKNLLFHYCGELPRPPHPWWPSRSTPSWLLCPELRSPPLYYL